MSFYDECVKQRRFDLLRQWDTDKNLPLTPKSAQVWSKNKVHWMCEKGHSWQIAIQSRLTNDAGCPVCGYRTIVPGVNDVVFSNKQARTDLKILCVCVCTDLTVRWWISADAKKTYDLQKQK